MGIVDRVLKKFNEKLQRHRENEALLDALMAKSSDELAELVNFATNAKESEGIINVLKLAWKAKASEELKINPSPKGLHR